MRYMKRIVQKTVIEDSAQAFDKAMNDIFSQAMYGKDPEVHYFDGKGLCACVRYWVEEQIPETLADEYELKGIKCRCAECPMFKLPPDRRVKYVKCEVSKRLVGATSSACDEFFERGYVDAV